MSTTNKVPTADDIYAPFPNIQQSIEGKPYAATKQALKRALKANTESVHSDHGGGNHGHLIQTISTTVFLIVINNLVFDVTANLGNMPSSQSTPLKSKKRRSSENILKTGVSTSCTRTPTRRLSGSSLSVWRKKFIANLEDEKMVFEDHSVMELLT